MENEEFKEFETPALLAAMKIINLRVTDEIRQGEVNEHTITASEKMGRMLDEVSSRDVEG